jgi:hypothetical protein
MFPSWVVPFKPCKHILHRLPRSKHLFHNANGRLIQVENLAKPGVKNLAVITPGFSADSLETLEEIAGENAEYFHHVGGKNFAAIPCLNDSEPDMRVIEAVVLRELQGWV